MSTQQVQQSGPQPAIAKEVKVETLAKKIALTPVAREYAGREHKPNEIVPTWEQVASMGDRSFLVVGIDEGSDSKAPAMTVSALTARQGSGGGFNFSGGRCRIPLQSDYLDTLQAAITAARKEAGV